jgi:hypothetical protein
MELVCLLACINPCEQSSEPSVFIKDFLIVTAYIHIYIAYIYTVRNKYIKLFTLL